MSLEINTKAFTLTGAALSQLQNNLHSTWEHCRQAAKASQFNVFAMGLVISAVCKVALVSKPETEKSG